MGTSISNIIVVTTPALGVAPGLATGLTISNLSTSSLTFSWSPPATGSTPFTYQPQQSVDGGNTWTNLGAQISTLSVGVTGLTPNTAYSFRVITSNNTASSTSAAIGATTLSILPNAPTGLAVVGAPTSTSVNLQWNAPTTGTTPFTYQILGRTPTGTGTFAAMGSTTTALTQSLTGLSPAASYDFEVTAANLAGTGPASTVLTNVQTAGSTGSLPGPATSLTFSNITATSLTLSWTAPTAGTTPFSYQPQQATPAATPVWTNIGTPISTTSVNVTGLTPNTAYEFQIVTTNSAGSSTSASATATTASVLPGAPTGLQTSGSPTTTTVPLAWTAPATGTTPLTYQVSLRTPTGSGVFSTFGTTTTSVTQTISGLTPATGYDFEVSATNGAGTGPESAILLNVVTATPAANAPGPATGLTVSALAATSLTLTWVAPSTGTTPFTYQPQQSTNNGSTWTNIGSGISALTVGVTGLTANTAYQFQIITTNSAGSSTSAAVSATTLSVLPGAPTGLAVVGSPTQTSIAVQWVAPATGTAPLTYQLSLRTPSGSGTFSAAGATTTALTQTASGLSPATTYDFEVSASNAAGTGPQSAILSNISTSAATGVLPSAPTNLAATNVTSSTIALSWTAPATGSTPFQYVVQYQSPTTTPTPTATPANWITTTYTSVTGTTVTLNQSTAAAQGGPYPFYGTPSITANAYWEVVVTSPTSTTGTQIGIGPANGSATAIAPLLVWAQDGGISVNGGYENAGQRWATYGSPATLCFALDAVNGVIYGRVGATGQWNNSGTANPATNTGGLPITPLTVASGIVAGGQLYQFNSSAQGNFTSASFVGTPPAGFNPIP